MGGQRARGHLDLLLLGVLGGAPLHGYRVIARLREGSEGAFDLPERTVYPALHRLEAAGLLRSWWAEIDGRRRRMYELTGTGARALSGGRDDWRRLFGVGAALLLVQSAGTLAFRVGPESGAMLGGGIVCLLAAAAFLPTLVRILALRLYPEAGTAETGEA